MKIKAGIRGGAGYTAGELIRILLLHPQCELVCVQSDSMAGERISDVHRDLLGETDLVFVSDINKEIDLLFLCQGHGESEKYFESVELPPDLKIIDFSQDFRFRRTPGKEFVYGLPEAGSEKIRKACYVANPGCFATAILLALLPLAAQKAIKHEIHATGITGSTGAGANLSATSHFSWRSGNISLYKPFSHQHLYEIRNMIELIQPEFDQEINFLPLRGDFTRGIFMSLYLKTAIEQQELMQIYKDYYQYKPFTLISADNPNLKQVINTNKCHIYLEKAGETLLLVSVLDNLLKGAAGQAVQNMNIMFGFPEACGLKLKSVAF